MGDRISDELLRDIERALVAIDASKPYRYKPTTSLPSLSPQMQAALDAEAEMVAKVLKRARQKESDLDALRADLRKAVNLLVQAWSEGAGDATWSRETQALMAKYEETP